MHASSFAQSRKHPDILRCREYVSSGGGVSRCLSITGIRPWIRAAVLCLPKSNDSSLENGSPSIITASMCAFSIIWSQKNYVELRKEEQKLGFLCQNHGNIQHESKFIYRCNSSKINSLLDKVGITSLQSASKLKKRVKLLRCEKWVYAFDSKPVRKPSFLEPSKTPSLSPSDAALITSM